MFFKKILYLIKLKLSAILSHQYKLFIKKRAMSEIGYHRNFDKYVEEIVANPVYEGLYYDRNKKNKVNWVVTGKSKKGQKRQGWWDAKCAELGIPIQKGCYAKVARMIHPTGYHVCQCCGERRSIFYEYPTLRTLVKINSAFRLNLTQTDYTIRELVRKFCKTPAQMCQMASILHLPRPNDLEHFLSMIKVELIDKESALLSPGVMCNPPDRFNGFHSYALCCRKAKDLGRHDDNMKTYTQDRRAYEQWSDGDYNLANRLMGEFQKCPPMICPICNNVAKMTADHIGPISLGFCHSGNFAPMCSSCNSAKNNRFTMSDVEKLLELELRGEQVVSWHSKFIWDLLKNEIHTDLDAKKASSVMAKCHQNILYIFSLIHKATNQNFLIRYLHPEYSMFDYRFKNVDLKNLDNTTIIKIPLNSKNKRKNQERYIRIAFESLQEFGRKKNRKNYYLYDKGSEEIKPIINSIHLGLYIQADEELRRLLNKVSEIIYQIEWKQT
jgi:Alw26I/Eco31I/Esp3I family type II restriction endonuclease